jgi:hypothetical protein
MNCRISAAIGAGIGGLTTVAFLSAGAAAADSGTDGASVATFPEVPGADAFRIGGYTFDPFTVNSDGVEVQGFAPVTPSFSFPPFVEVGGGDVSLPGSPIPLATQAFDVYLGSASADDIRLVGIVDTNEDVVNLLGMTNTEFSIDKVAPAAGLSDAVLPTVGTVYDVFNLGHGFENIYVDLVNPVTGAGTVQDALATPFGEINLSSLVAGFDAITPLNPGEAFTGLTDAAGLAASVADVFSLLTRKIGMTATRTAELFIHPPQCTQSEGLVRQVLLGLGPCVAVDPGRDPDFWRRRGANHGAAPLTIVVKRTSVAQVKPFLGAAYPFATADKHAGLHAGSA